MALVLADRVLETTSVAGTGDASLAGAIVGYQPFSVVGNGNTTYYTIVAVDDQGAPTGDWEVGIGTYVLAGNKIARDTVLSSSNGGALVYFASGTKQIFLDLPSEELPSGGGGDVTGPASAVANNFAAFNMTTGKLIKDSGYNASSFATAAQGAKADTAVQPGSLATVATTGAYADLTGKPTLGTAAALDAGVANGVATLDSGGKVPTSQIPQMGDLNYQGTWNASTNTPTLTSSSGTKGFYYVVSVAGTTNLNGITDWQVGDWAVYNGSVWQKIDNTDLVTSVNGYTGTVVLNATDVGAAPATSGTSILYGNGSGGTSNVTIGTGVSFVGGTLSATGAGGDVVGPASSTDNAIARFDTTTGKLLQNSVVTIDDSGNISGANSISTIDYAQLDTAAAASIALGKLRWNTDTATAAFGIIDGTTEVNIGQQMYAYVTNAESVTITAGQAVYLYQATGNRASVKLAYNTGDATSAKTLGLVTADIAAGATGFVTTQGVLSKLNTGAYAEGDTLYLGATAGSLTATKPKAPNHLVYIGVVERANNGNGQIYVRVQNGYELDEIHDVQINSPANGQTILYDASTSLWKNANLTAGTGVSIANGAASVTITNSAPDRTVAITPTAPISVTGTYPNFSISISQATTSTNGYLSSTDWNTFNNKVSSPWTLSGTDVYYNGGNVGIGASAPTAQLQIYKPTGDSSFIVENGGVSGTDTAYAQIASGLYRNKNIVYANGDAYLISSATNFNVGTDAGTPLTLITDSVERIRIDSGGNVGVATLSPTEKLDVNGNAKATSFIKTGGTSSQFLKADGSVDSSTYLTTAVTSLAGTANQITASASTGSVTLSTPSTFIAPGSIEATTSVTGTLVNATNGIFINALTINASYTIPAGSSGMSVGPVTTASGVTVTVSSGSRWVVL